MEALREVLDALPDAVLVVDGAGTVRFANRHVEAVLGYDPDDLEGDDDPAVGELLAELAIEALETNSTVTRRLGADEREETVDRIDTLPRYEGNDEFESAVYITYSEQAAAVFSERHL